jgi:hypothetical protein
MTTGPRSRTATRRARLRQRPSATSAAARIARARAAERERADEGFAMSSPIALMSAAAVALAGVAFLFTGGHQQSPQEVALAAAPSKVEQAVVLKAKPVAETIDRSKVYVSVYNNTNVTGLAGTTAARIDSAGWQVVGSDNWVGTIPATTIYYPPQLEAAAKLLGKDLGVNRVLPAVAPMSMSGLTVILTADFA